MQEKVQYRDGLRKNATTKNRRQSTETKSRSLHGGLGQCQRNWFANRRNRTQFNIGWTHIKRKGSKRRPLPLRPSTGKNTALMNWTSSVLWKRYIRYIINAVNFQTFQPLLLHPKKRLNYNHRLSRWFALTLYGHGSCSVLRHIEWFANRIFFSSHH